MIKLRIFYVAMIACLSASAFADQKGSIYFSPSFQVENQVIGWDRISFIIKSEANKEVPNIDFRYRTLLNYYALISNTPIVEVDDISNANYQVYFRDDVQTKEEILSYLKSIKPEYFEAARQKYIFSSNSPIVGCYNVAQFDPETKRIKENISIIGTGLDETNRKNCVESTVVSAFGVTIAWQNTTNNPDSENQKIFIDAYFRAPTILWAQGICNEYLSTQSVDCVEAYAKAADPNLLGLIDGKIPGKSVSISKKQTVGE